MDATNKSQQDVDTSGETDDGACRNLLTISSPTSSDGYYSSPLISPADEASNKHGSDEKRSPSTGVELVGEASNHSHSDVESWVTRPLISTQLFPETATNSEIYADDIAPEIPTNNPTISPFTRELITRSRQEMERRRQKRLQSSSQSSFTKIPISDLIIPEDPPVLQHVAASPTEEPVLTATNPFDDSSLVAEYFQAEQASTDDSPHVIANDRDDEPSDANANIVDEDMIVITHDAHDDKDSELPATTCDGAMELDDDDPVSMFPELTETPADAEESWPCQTESDDDDEPTEVQDIMTSRDVVFTNADPDAAEDSEFTASTVDYAVEQNDDDPMSTLLGLTEISADTPESWLEQPQSSDDNDDEPTEVQGTLANRDVEFTNADPDTTEDSELTAAIAGNAMKQNDDDPMSTLLEFTEISADTPESWLEQPQSSDDDDVPTEVQDIMTSRGVEFTNADPDTTEDSELTAATAGNAVEPNDDDPMSALLEMTEMSADTPESWLEQPQSSDEEPSEVRDTMTNREVVFANADPDTSVDSELTAATAGNAVEQNDDDPMSALLEMTDMSSDTPESWLEQPQSSGDGDEATEVRGTLTNRDVEFTNADPDTTEDSELTAATAGNAVEQNDDDPMSEFQEMTVMSADTPESWLEQPQSSDEEPTEVRDAMTNREVSFTNAGPDTSVDSELTAATAENDVQQNDHDPMSTLLSLTETQSDDREPWPYQAESDDSDEEQTGGREEAKNATDAVTNGDIEHDDTSRFTATNYEFVIGINDLEPEASASPSDPRQRDPRNREKGLATQNQSTTSLDFDAVFGHKHSISSMQEASRPSTASSMSLSRLVFGNQHDPCCSGRRGWVVFLAVVVLIVILIAALVGKQSSSNASSVVHTRIPSSSPTSEPSITPSVEPSSVPTSEPSIAPSVELSTAPTLEPSNPLSFSPSTLPSLIPTTAPSVPVTPAPVFPPFAFTLTFPPYGWSSLTSAPSGLEAPLTEASPIGRALLRMASPAATPTPDGASNEVPPHAFPVLTYPPFAEVRPLGRNLRSRVPTGASSELGDGVRLQLQD